MPFNGSQRMKLRCSPSSRGQITTAGVSVSLLIVASTARSMSGHSRTSSISASSPSGARTGQAAMPLLPRSSTVYLCETAKTEAPQRGQTILGIWLSRRHTSARAL